MKTNDVAREFIKQETKTKETKKEFIKRQMKTKKGRKDSQRGDEDGGNEERMYNTMKKKEGIEWSDLVKKMTTKNSQNIYNKRKQQSEDMLEQRRKKKKEKL